ncbi:MAG: hypothetical protein AAGC60_03710 [Acidobacteriota bacterium]
MARHIDSRRIHSQVLLPLGLSLVALSLLACGDGRAEDSSESTPWPVKLITVEAAGSEQIRRYPATVKAATSSTLTFQASGIVQLVPVNEAQQVERGAHGISRAR